MLGAFRINCPIMSLLIFFSVKNVAIQQLLHAQKLETSIRDPVDIDSTLENARLKARGYLSRKCRYVTEIQI